MLNMVTTYFCDVHWLDRNKILKCVFVLWNKIAAFMQSKDIVVQNFTDKAWLGDLSFLTTQKKLQGKDNLIYEPSDALKASELKLDWWINQLKRKCYHTFSTFVVLPNFKHEQMCYYAAGSENTIRLARKLFLEK